MRMRSSGSFLLPFCPFCPLRPCGSSIFGFPVQRLPAMMPLGYRVEGQVMRHVAGRIAFAVLLTLGAEGCMNGSAETPTQKSGDAFAADREEPAKPAEFDPKRAFGYLEELCKIGPRISGSDGM